MKQYLLVLLVSLGLGGLVSSQMNIVAADQLPNFEATATSGDEVAPLDSTLLSEITPVAEAEMADLSESPEMSHTYSYSYTYSAPVQQVVNYNVVSRASITKDPGNTINLTKKAVWGHNDPNLLLSALSMHSGSVFTITTEDGNVKSYVVSHTEIYSVAELNAQVTPGKSKNKMYEVAYEAKDRNGNYHSLVLFTCYEQTRNAEHRFVVFADAL